jgi:hypothetical protein
MEKRKEGNLKMVYKSQKVEELKLHSKESHEEYRTEE